MMFGSTLYAFTLLLSVNSNPFSAACYTRCLRKLMASVGEARYVGNIHHNFPRGGGVLCNYYIKILPSDVECNYFIIKALFICKYLLHTSIMLEKHKKIIQ